MLDGPRTVACIKHVEVTTLTNKKVIIEAAALGDQTIEALKSALNDSEGVPTDQQSFYFPVADWIEGCQPATDFKWWAETQSRLEPELRDAMLAQKLIKGELVPADTGNNMGAATLGAIVAFQNDGAAPQYLSDVVVRCFMVLQLRASPGESDDDRSGMISLEAKKEAAVTDVELMSEGDADEMLENAFAVFDADNSGTISVSELRDILNRMVGGGYASEPLSEADAEEIIKDADVNADGVLDIAEFCKLMKSRSMDEDVRKNVE